jgi:type II secretion system protein G
MQGIINTVKWRWPKWGMRHPVRPEQEEGLTLIEMLAVVLILGIVATIAVPSVTSAIGQAKINATESNLGTLQTALSEYYVSNGSYPSTLSELTGPASTNPPPAGPAQGPVGPYIHTTFPENDAWGHPIYYQVLGGGKGYVLLSGDGQALSPNSSASGLLEYAGTPLTYTAGTTPSGSLISTKFIYAAGGTGPYGSSSPSTTSYYVATGPTLGTLSSNLAAAIDYAEVTDKTSPVDQ